MTRSPSALLRDYCRPWTALILSTLLFAGLLTPLPAHAAPTMNEMEPNEKTSTAQKVDLGTTVLGSFGGRHQLQDVYRFVNPKAGRLEIDLRFDDGLGTEGFLVLDVLNAEGVRIYQLRVLPSEYNGSVLRSRAFFVASGTFYVSLYAYQDVWEGEKYTLKSSVAPATAETEPNQSTATADVIALGRMTLGAALPSGYTRSTDDDYYRLPLSKQTTIQTDFRFVCNLGTSVLYRIRLLDNGGRTLLDGRLTGADCAGNSVRAKRITAPAGNLYVYIYSSEAGGLAMGKQYSLKVSEASPFFDVKPGVEHYDAMVWMKEQGISTGWADGTYRPLSPVNRDAMAAFLYRHAGSPTVTLPKTSPFRDVRPTDQHYKAIIWAYQKGITTGWTTARGREFRPVQPIARDAMAAFLFRYAGSPSYSMPSGRCFIDVKRSQLFAKEMCWMRAKGVSTGWSDGTYRPLESVKRDAMAAFLYRYATTR